MRVTISTPSGYTRSFDARDFDEFGSTPDHFDLIAPAYLDLLTSGYQSVSVRYVGEINGERFSILERHTACGWRDGAVVGTTVEYPGEDGRTDKQRERDAHDGMSPPR